MLTKHSHEEASCRQLQLTRRPELKIAALSELLMPLMREHNLGVEFLSGGHGGLYIADVTRNPTNAYKLRGALASADAAVRDGKSLLVTASAGNHGAGIACAARLKGLQARVYVPTIAPAAKIKKIEEFGAEVVRVGANFDETLAHARRDVDVRSARGKFVHPFDDIIVAAGQGTIGVELLERVNESLSTRPADVVRIFLPIGGGGLMAGVASVMKTKWPATYPKLEIVGVVDESAPASLIATLFGRPVRVVPNTIADGTQVAMVGETFLSVSHLVDRLMLVPHDAIVSAMRSYESLTHSRLEPSGALALAGEQVASSAKLFGDKALTTSFAVVTGRNFDAARYDATLAEAPRLNAASHLRQGFDVVIEERSGELLHFLKTVKGYNIASLTYKQRPGTRAGHLRVEFEIETDVVDSVERALEENFPGSRRLMPGEQMIYEVGRPVAQKFKEELITLTDAPGSFLQCVERLTSEGAFGSVGFLFYRKPAHAGAVAQVVIGRHQ
jgi:threonine dehydratase